MHACMHGTCGHFCRPCCATLLHTLPVQALLRRCCYSYASLLLPTAYNSSWAAREQERRDWILKKDPENEIISGPPGPGAPPRG
jgi:hypothetical protein